ncbi:MAG: hypothetical protein V4669_07580 [Pseudomonadota bacterium]
MPQSFRHLFVLPAVLSAMLLAAGAQAQVPSLMSSSSNAKHLAPGFAVRPATSKLVIVPSDMELFSISAGGVSEPRADWTQAAQKNFKSALDGRRNLLGANAADMPEAVLDDFAELHALHRAVAEAIFVHHANSGLKLPTKNEQLDWSLGADSVKPLKERTGADYALFTWFRDSYASGERKAVMIGMALLGSFQMGGYQMGYASLVDLNTGRVVWFNDLQRMTGDLREASSAKETVEALLKDFPELK